MRSTRRVLMLMGFAMILSACASPRPVVCEERPQLPAELKRSRSPDAKASSSEVRKWLGDVATYFSTQPELTTPSSKQ